MINQIARSIVRRFNFLAVPLLFIAVFLLPWKTWAAHELKTIIESKGFQDVSLTLTNISLQEANVANIKLSGNFNFTIDDVSVSYSAVDYVMYIAGFSEAPQVDVSADNIIVQKDKYTLTAPLALIDVKLGKTLSGILHVPSASMSFMGGHLTTKDLTIPLEEPRIIHLNLDLHRVSVANLFGMLAGTKTVATGRISGTLPITINADRTIVFHKGELKSERAGTIIMPPEIIPGDHAQVEFVRQVLKNFHYDLLLMTLNSTQDNKMVIGLRIEGKNPDVMNGREIKLNVNLTGDMINLVQQNMMIFGDPHKLLERGQNE